MWRRRVSSGRGNGTSWRAMRRKQRSYFYIKRETNRENDIAEIHEDVNQRPNSSEMTEIASSDQSD